MINWNGRGRHDFVQFDTLLSVHGDLYTEEAQSPMPLAGWSYIRQIQRWLIQGLEGCWNRRLYNKGVSQNKRASPVRGGGRSEPVTLCPVRDGNEIAARSMQKLGKMLIL